MTDLEVISNGNLVRDFSPRETAPEMWDYEDKKFRKAIAISITRCHIQWASVHLAKFDGTAMNFKKIAHEIVCRADEAMYFGSGYARLAYVGIADRQQSGLAPKLDKYKLEIHPVRKGFYEIPTLGREILADKVKIPSKVWMLGAHTLGTHPEAKWLTASQIVALDAPDEVPTSGTNERLYGTASNDEWDDAPSNPGSFNDLLRNATEDEDDA